LMDDCELLIARVAAELGLGGVICWQGRKIGLAPPWERITVREAFFRHAGTTVEDALRRDRFDEIMACEIEPHLGMDRPIFLYDYPAELGALARLKAEDPGLASGSSCISPVWSWPTPFPS
jgi:elongation factor P--(R)-beta-lysine ligase